MCFGDKVEIFLNEYFLKSRVFLYFFFWSDRLCRLLKFFFISVRLREINVIGSKEFEVVRRKLCVFFLRLK